MEGRAASCARRSASSAREAASSSWACWIRVWMEEERRSRSEWRAESDVYVGVVVVGLGGVSSSDMVSRCVWRNREESIMCVGVWVGWGRGGGEWGGGLGEESVGKKRRLSGFLVVNEFCWFGC